MPDAATVAAVAAVASAAFAGGGLIYAGYQIGQQVKVTRIQIYMSWLDKYFHLKELLIDNSDLQRINKTHIHLDDLSAQQKKLHLYSHCVL